jgi:predicted unusual protein kinase regulating ubiquinone biosynthesis (AarF/ABC1/UbiB family)
MGMRTRRVRRALEVTRIARRGRLLRALRELHVVGERPATREGAQEFRGALEEAGTAYLKLGQLLSSRPDLLPDVYIEELGKLVDDVPPLGFAEVEPAILEDLGRDVFVSIDPVPLASASIAQIHPALLADGREVVVKVRRPGIVEQVALDLDLLRRVAARAERHSETARLLQLQVLADELETHLSGELDFREEASNAELVAGVVEQYELLRVPQVIRPHVTDRVLVLERIHGKKVDSGHSLSPDRARELARQFFRAYIHQICLEGLYHADPHRGNVLLTEDNRLALLDFGLLGRLDEDTRTTLALLLMAVANNRADDVADLILSLSLTSMSSDEAGFVQELRRKLPRYHWRSISGIRTGEALADLQRIALRAGIRLPPAFALVGKTLAQADQIARALDPELDPIELLREEGMDLMRAEAQRRLDPNRVAAYAFAQTNALARLPRRVVQVVERLETGTMKVGVVPTDLGHLEHILRSAANRIGAAMIVVGLLVASALMARVSHLVALIGFCLSGAIALYMIWRIVRTPGEL